MSEDCENMFAPDTRSKKAYKNGSKRINYKENLKRGYQIEKRHINDENAIEDADFDSFERPQKMKKYTNGKPERKQK